jgi:glycosyltransferase involved in cell wall biosynthesis
MNKEPKVSVCIITYNQERYIKDCLEGVLMQITDDYEIVIGDDCSTDNTSAICQEYQNKYPDLIKYYRREKNLGMIGNWIQTIKDCLGEYIALCEGDDYWTDPHKLQKQVDLLEANPNLMGCFHNSEERYCDTFDFSSSLYINNCAGKIYKFEEFALHNFAPTASLIIRNNQPLELNTELFKSLKIGDWPLSLLMLREDGLYYYIPHVMSVHNLYHGGVWSHNNQLENVKTVRNTCNLLINSNWFSDYEVNQLSKTLSKLDKIINENINLKIEDSVNIFDKAKYRVNNLLRKFF